MIKTNFALRNIQILKETLPLASKILSAIGNNNPDFNDWWEDILKLGAKLGKTEKEVIFFTIIHIVSLSSEITLREHEKQNQK